MMPKHHMIESDPEVAGWGAIDMMARRFSDVLQYVFVPFSNHDNCSDIYKVRKKNTTLSFVKLI